MKSIDELSIRSSLVIIKQWRIRKRNGAMPRGQIFLDLMGFVEKSAKYKVGAPSPTRNPGSASVKDPSTPSVRVNAVTTLQ